MAEEKAKQTSPPPMKVDVQKSLNEGCMTNNGQQKITRTASLGETGRRITAGRNDDLQTRGQNGPAPVSAVPVSQAPQGRPVAPPAAPPKDE